MPEVLRILPVLLACLLTATPAAAHKLKVFATAQGATVSGYVYLSGGSRPAGVPVTVQTPDGETLATLETGGDGRFSFEAGHRRDHVIVAEIDGHRGTWTVPAKDLPPHLPGPAGSGADSAAASPAAPAHPAQPPAASSAELRTMVEEAVARQVAPLREQLNTYEDSVRWHDVLGGLGWIAGLFGVAAWVSARRRAA